MIRTSTKKAFVITFLAASLINTLVAVDIAAQMPSALATKPILHLSKEDTQTTIVGIAPDKEQILPAVLNLGTDGWEVQSQTLEQVDASQALDEIIEITSGPNKGQIVLKTNIYLKGQEDRYKIQPKQKISIPIVVAKQEAEIFLELRDVQRLASQVPVNMIGKELSVWVYLPDGLLRERGIANYLMIGLKDVNYQSLYSTAVKITPARVNGWINIRLQPARIPATPEGFDITKTVLVVLKVGLGAGLEAQYQGPIYVKNITIQPQTKLVPIKVRLASKEKFMQNSGINYLRSESFESSTGGVVEELIRTWRNYKKDGNNIIRVPFYYHLAYGLKFDSQNNPVGFKKDPFGTVIIYKDVNSILEAAQRTDMKVILVLFDGRTLEGETKEYGVHTDLVTDQIKRDALADLMGEFANHYKNNRRFQQYVSMVDIINEPGNMAISQIGKTNMSMFVERIAGVFKEASILTTVGSHNFEDATIWEELVDYSQIHWYLKDQTDWPIENIELYLSGFSKPFFFGELESSAAIENPGIIEKIRKAGAKGVVLWPEQDDWHLRKMPLREETDP